MDAIVAAWAKRQEKVKSIKFSWREELVGPTGTATAATHRAMIDEARFAYVADNDPYPPDIASVIIDREEGKPPKKDAQGRPAPNGNVGPARIAFNGTTTRDYRALNHATMTGIGHTRSGFQIAEAHGQALEPVLVMFRPFDVNLGRINPNDYHVSALQGKIGDTACVIIERTEAARWPIRTLYYWLDPTRDYIVLRKQQILNGRSQERMDISYRNDPAFGWIPEGCHEFSISDVGNLCSSFERVDHRLGHQPADPRLRILGRIPERDKSPPATRPAVGCAESRTTSVGRVSDEPRLAGLVNAKPRRPHEAAL